MIASDRKNLKGDTNRVPFGKLNKRKLFPSLFNDAMEKAVKSDGMPDAYNTEGIFGEGSSEEFLQFPQPFQH